MALIIGKVARGILVGYYRLRLAHAGRRLRIGLGTTILNPSVVSIGDDVYLGPGAYITSPSGIYIGNRAMFGPQVMLVGGDHDLFNTEVPLRFAPAPPKPPPIVIEDDAWIGARTTILKAVRIGRGAVIGACSVVTRDIPPWSIAAGNPCRVLRERAPLPWAERVSIARWQER